jgi:hypothetical protein
LAPPPRIAQWAMRRDAILSNFLADWGVLQNPQARSMRGPAWADKPAALSIVSHAGLLVPMESLRKIVIAGLAAGLCVAASQERPDRVAAVRTDDFQAWEHVRDSDSNGRRICAVDRLAESRLPRTTCRTAREWRERQLHDLRRQ